MKLTARILSFMAMAVFSLSVYAAGQFTDIQKQMMAHNWPQSEQMLKTYLAQKPDSAKANYLLAQVYEQTRRYDLAQQYLTKANAIDPMQKFASTGQAINMANRLAVKTATNTRVQSPRTPSYHTPVQPTPVQVPAQAPQHNGGSGFGTFLIVLLILSAIGGAAYWWFTNRAKKQTIDRLNDERRALQAQSVQQQERVADLRKKLGYENQLSSDLAQDVNQLSSDINNLATKLRIQIADVISMSNTSAQVDAMENRLSNCESRLQRKSFDAPSAPRAPTSTAASIDEPRDSTWGRRVDISQESTYQPPAPAYRAPYTPPVQQTVVHEHYHDNSPDLLTTMVVANAINSNHNDGYAERALRDERDRNDRLERELERERENERSTYQSNSYQAPALDLGSSDDDDDNRRNTSSPSMDFGGSDDSSSSSDFGGSDD